MKARILMLLITLAPLGAQATHDGGNTLSIIRFSEDGRLALVADCHVQGHFEGLTVRPVGKSKVIARYKGDPDLEDLPDMENLCGMLEDVQTFLSQQKTGSLSALIKTHKLTQAPAKGALSPQKDRYVFLTAKSQRLQPRVAEGQRVVKRGRPISFTRDSPSASAWSDQVLWHPSGRLAVVEVSAVERFGDGVVMWASHWRVLRFKGAATPPLNHQALSKALNNEGYARDKAARKRDPAYYGEQREMYAAAVRVDPKNHTALYNLACMHALQGAKREAIKTLERLAALKTKAAKDKLQKAPKDGDFKSLRNNERFVALTTVD